jgi:ornithine decarboxylase
MTARRAPAANLPTIDQVVADLQPADPLICLRPSVFEETARAFVNGFPGDVLYAIKCNPAPLVVEALWRGGIRHFDVASPGEVKQAHKQFPSAGLHYMNPVKSVAHTRDAYFRCGVKDYSLDSFDELERILTATGNAKDLGLLVRLALPKGNARSDLSGKFGTDPETAGAILRLARDRVERIGICYHVGSQCLDPEAWVRASELAGRAIAASGVPVDIVDVGGGFPVAYPEETPVALDAFFAAIQRGVDALDLRYPVRLWCEPGRALVGAGGSVVVRVEARRGDILHINDGGFGNLYDGSVGRWRYPTRRVGDSWKSTAPQGSFSFYGPTCDNVDYMPGPFLLPADIAVGDWIEVAQAGAYSTCLRTDFNGFEPPLWVEVSDQAALVTPGHEVSDEARQVA